MSDEISSMKLAKTEAGKAALMQRSLCTPRERQVMILCDGQRTVLDLVRMMGKDVLPVIASLQVKGHVLTVTPMLVRLGEFPATGTLAWAESQWPQTRAPEPLSRGGEAKPVTEPAASPRRPAHLGTPMPVQAPVSLPQVKSPTTQPLPSVTFRTAATKRSLAGAKMYILDVLRMQRSAVSQQWIERLQAVSDPSALCEEASVLVAHLHRQCGASYTERVVCQLLDLLPEARVAEFCCHMALLDLPDLRVLDWLDA